MEEVDPQPGLRANSPRLIKYDALILRKKERKREREWVGEKEGADSYVYADMYFKASISPTLRRFVIGVGCILRYFRFTMASLPPYLILGGRRSNESPKHCVESIPRADIFVFDVFEATPIASPTNFSIVTRFFIFQDGWNIGNEKSTGNLDIATISWL